VIPVLAVRDKGAAKRGLRDVFGFLEEAPDRMMLGEQVVLVCDRESVPTAFVALPFDHVALSVTDVDTAFDDLTTRGATLDPAFTPAGPVEIPEFWSNGVRFVFLQGPEDARIEFCQKLGAETGPGHSHYGLRTPLLDETENLLAARGATRIARHVLHGTPPVAVRFVAHGDQVFELFTEAPKGDTRPDEGWVGFVDGCW